MPSTTGMSSMSAIFRLKGGNAIAMGALMLPEGPFFSSGSSTRSARGGLLNKKRPPAMTRKEVLPPGPTDPEP
eukprot:11477688-Heterocapsa_arctica.AAC.1